MTTTTRTPIPGQALSYVQTLREYAHNDLAVAVAAIGRIFADEGIDSYTTTRCEKVIRLEASLRFWTGVKESLEKSQSIEYLMNTSWFDRVPDDEEDRTNLRGLFMILFPLD